ncbi:S8 family serine peptidase [Paenibacillus fonticola]|uniref:S8 family serine peptidase n=1 Tax=Paenibacillus fonticola TaxID=379896 RepID=UPI000373F1D1|nr:S8 family serine peptidase [Paenibacillus fonticola]
MLKKSLMLRKWFAVILAFAIIIGAFPGYSNATELEPPSLPALSELVSQSETAEAFISPEIDTNSSDKVRVIVQLNGQPAAVGKYAARLGIRSLASAATESIVRHEQQNFLNEVQDQGLELQVNYQYNTVFNGFEVTIPADEIPALAQIPGVKSIQENSIWYPLPITPSTDEAINFDSIPLKQIGADLAWAEGLTGKGLKVGVIDTGVDYTHPDLQEAYKGGYDSFYKDDDPYEEIPLTPAEDPLHVGYGGTSHGTHVAGIIVGRAANPTADIVQKGVAYEAELYVYKVLGRSLTEPYQASGTSAQLIDGIERAVNDGMDVINLSLGSDIEKNVNSPDAIAINNAVLSGVTAIIANGNAGPGYYTMGSPATSQLALAVGAVTSEGTLYKTELAPALVNSPPSTTEATYTAPPTSVTIATYDPLQLNVIGWQSGHTDFAAILGTEPLDVVYVGLGGIADYTSDVSGKIVLASRGKLSFTEKIVYAQQFGAKAIVIFNGTNDGDDADLSESIADRDGYIDTLLADNPLFIPTFDMRGTEGRALARAVRDNPDLSLQFTFGAEYEPSTIPGDTLASFSAWGPNADANLSIKPDVLAPGVNILSTYPAYGKYNSGISYDNAYLRSNGTSMSAPYVSGLALLLKELHPDWTPFDIRAALANTADVIRGEDKPVYDVYQQGAGRVNVANAINTPAVLQALEPITILDTNFSPQNVINYNSSASFGIVAPGGVSAKNLQLKNTSQQDVSYEASVEWHHDHPGVAMTLDKSLVTAAAGTAAVIKLDLQVSTDAQERAYQGQINLVSAGLPTLHLPFTVQVGYEQPVNGFGIQELMLTHSTVYPNRSAQQYTDLSFKLTAEDTNYFSVEVENLDNETLGFFVSEIPNDLSERFEPGIYTIPGIGGSYHPYDENGYPILQDGLPVLAQLNNGTYKITVTAAQITPDGNLAYDGGRPIYYRAVSSYRVDNSVPSSDDCILKEASDNPFTSFRPHQPVSQEAAAAALEVLP